MTTLETIQRMIADEAEVKLDDLDPGRPLEELGVDSLTVLELMFKIEERF